MRTVLMAAVLASAALPAAAEPDPAFGEWLNEDGFGRVAVAPCSADPALACGAITWLKDPVHHPSRDVNNPDRSLRGRPLVGVLVIRDMKSAGPGRWRAGKLYDPESGKTYDGRLRVLTRNRLQVSGCVLMICDSETWTRAD
ncbi:MAG TPA: DUF2147 domain-containing protein [Phenylobacterium sp.]|nr:DUF2147 domain-containing protein [Phenylobacterium sp.]